MTDNQYHLHMMDCARILLTHFIKNSEQYSADVFWDCVNICRDTYVNNKSRLDD